MDRASPSSRRPGSPAPPFSGCPRAQLGYEDFCSDYLSLIANIPGVVYRGTGDWHVHFFDNKVELFTGYTADTFHSGRLRWSDLILPQDMEAAKEETRRAIQSGRSYVREYRIRNSTGAVRWIQDRGTITLDSHGQIQYFMGIFFDVTDMKLMAQKLERTVRDLAAAHEELQRRYGEIQELNETLERRVEEGVRELLASERQYRRLFENSRDLIYITDAQGTVTDMNPSGLELLGYDERPSDPLTIKTLFVDPVQAREYLKALRSRGYVRDLEAAFSRRDGSACPVLISAQAVRDERGRFLGTEGIAKDLTHIRQATEAVARAQKMATIGRLAAGVAHEINTPLQVILSNVQLAMDDVPEGSGIRRAMETIEAQTKLCARIVSQLLDFSRQRESTLESMDLNEAIEQVLAVMEHSLVLDHVRVVKRLSAELPPVRADRDKIRQVISNLVANAHQAVEEGGAVAIVTLPVESGSEVLMMVADTGPGIAEGIRQKIFDPFFTTKGYRGGVGLGLAVVYGIVEEHGGRISVESPVPDDVRAVLAESGLEAAAPGTAFFVHLPVTGRLEAAGPSTAMARLASPHG